MSGTLVRIFISYSRTDSAFVDRLEDSLKERGFHTWVDRRKIEGGQDWMDELQKGIKQCHACIVVVSPQAIASQYVKMEYRYAFLQKKLVVPVFCVPTPNNDMPIDLNHLHWIDFQSSYGKGLAGLLSTLQPMVDGTGAAGVKNAPSPGSGVSLPPTTPAQKPSEGVHKPAAPNDLQKPPNVASPQRQAAPVRIASPALGTRLAVYQGHSNQVTSIAWSPDGKRIASSSWDDTIQIWDVITRKQLLTWGIYLHRGVTAAWSPDGTRIASEHEGYEFGLRVKVWESSKGHKIFTLSSHPQKHLHFLAWSPDGKRLAIGQGAVVQVRDAPIEGKLQYLVKEPKILVEHTHPQVTSHYYGSITVSSLVWSPDGTTITALTSDQAIHIWNATTGETLFTFSLKEVFYPSVEKVAFSPDSHRLAFVKAHNKGYNIAIWDIAAKKSLFECEGASTGITALAWSPDNCRIASGSLDKTVQIWDATTGKHSFTYQGHNDSVYALAWSPDSSRIASGGGFKYQPDGVPDFTVHIWQAA